MSFFSSIFILILFDNHFIIFLYLLYNILCLLLWIDHKRIYFYLEFLRLCFCCELNQHLLWKVILIYVIKFLILFTLLVYDHFFIKSILFLRSNVCLMELYCILDLIQILLNIDILSNILCGIICLRLTCLSLEDFCICFFYVLQIKITVLRLSTKQLI